jgi:hypothetical protein
MTALPGIEIKGNKRRWRDVSAMRLTIALLVGPILSLALLVAIVALIIAVAFPSEDWSFAKEDWVSFALIVGYWVLAGWCYRLLIARWRGIVSRVECLLLGMTMTIVAPLPLALPWLILCSPPHAKINLVVENALDLARVQPGLIAAYWIVISLFSLPLGVFCGWILWRVGVRPAKPRLADAAVVFE